MSLLLIPTDPTSLYYDESVVLEGVEYLFEFFWSGREGCWYLNLYDQDESPIALWIRVVINWNLTRRFLDTRLPAGMLFCSDRTGTDQDVSMFDPTELGDRVRFYYLTSDDPNLALYKLAYS